jgi:hypothetical protein
MDAAIRGAVSLLDAAHAAVPDHRPT